MAANSEKFPSFSLSTPNTQFDVGVFGSSTDEALPPPPPCVEVFVSEMSVSSASLSSTAKYTAETVNVDADLTLLKGRVSTQEVFTLANSDLVPGKYEGGLKLWEGSFDLIKTLQSEIKDGELCVKGKRILELGCGHGLPGIFTCLEGAAVVHLQDFNAEVLRCLTIPNVSANLSKESQQPSVTNETETNIQADVRYFAGDWSEIHQLLPYACKTEYQLSPNLRDEQESCDGYDVILMAETVYSISSLKNLYELMQKCLSRPNGIVYLAAKKHYFGVGGGTRQFLSVVEREGAMAAKMIAEVANGSSNVREVWKFSFK
ncbi:hypothetical protein GIB67_029272 [Kingdonia uniflora]|uniref:protein-histidine N-methyltransferase n=1 Tax=Kingdonia uniflora TaxID=39325 RepID=A0A7J7N8K3_9MAGN|nr:hypothetical protein GIB67_029272 [Kingdonia uniflora]